MSCIPDVTLGVTVLVSGIPNVTLGVTVLDVMHP